MDHGSTGVIGLLGTTLDMGKHPDRWQNWRPSVALCRQPDLIVKRCELLHGSREKSLADLVNRDVSTVPPEAEMRGHLRWMGPTEAGQPLVARRIYELKKVRHAVKGELVDVNFAALRGDGAMSALFGHTQGAFTGALKDRPGLLRTADAGVLLLDEIGELGADEQAMLLRALEEKTFLPMGSDKESSSDFQLIAGTNRD